MAVHTDYPPRVRVEWVIAGARVLLAAGALVGVTVGAPDTVPYPLVAALLGGYLAYTLTVLGLVWTPVRFGRGWDVAVHTFDFGVFSALMVFTQGAASPFFVYLNFLLIAAMLRWQVPGTLWTAGGVIVSYAAVSLYASYTLQLAGFELNTFFIRTLYLAVTTGLLWYLGAHQFRFQHEISRLAAWPRQISRDPREVISEIIAQSSELLSAPRIVLVWEEPGEGWVNLAWKADNDVLWTHEKEGTYGSFVLPGFERHGFQAADVGDERGKVAALVGAGFRFRECRPVNEALRARFNMRAVESWSLDGELIHGRLFCLDKPKMRLDDLILGSLVARLAVSRLDSLYLLARLREAAALDERIRVARDLHDSLLQSQAGNALQLLAARRLLDREPEAARERLADVQSQLERGELEMRSFIRRMSPSSSAGSDPTASSLSGRLEELGRRVERQWEIRVTMRVDRAVDQLPAALSDDIYRLAQEGVVNAARHADASAIGVNLSVSVDQLWLKITDDGRGFPFHGVFDLAALGELRQGPRTLRERVTELQGDLKLKSLDTGTELLITLPLALVAH
jgi:signal transduction histidine kinase